MLCEVEGFILSETSYGETSKIINVWTKKYGVIGIMCKGAKSLKSKNRVSTMRFSYAKFNIYLKQGKLSTLVSADVINPLKKIRSDITLIGYLSYLTELTEQVIKQNNDLLLFDDFINSVLKIEDGLDPLVITNILEIKYLEKLGVLFNLDECVVCGSKNNIVTINADKGGFICFNCLSNEVIVDKKVIKISAKTGENIEELYKSISKMYELNNIEIDDGEILTNIRHKQQIDEAIKSINEVKNTINSHMPVDIIEIYLKQVLADLGKITGDDISEDIINEIFSKFCLGK